MKTQEFGRSQEGHIPTLHEVLEFLHTQPLGSLATLSQQSKPQLARVAFSEHQGLKLVIGTDVTSRKAKNIRRNPAVAFEVTDPDRRFTVQFEGTARQLYPSEFESYAEAHFDKLPASAPFRDIAGQCYFVLQPDWVRFSDCNPHPWVLTEFTF